MLMVSMRLGIGFDIEATDDVCYMLQDGDTGNVYITEYEGLTIKLPFLRILIGSFYDVDLKQLDN